MVSLIDTIKNHIENEMIIVIKRTQVDVNDEIVGFPLILSGNLLVMSRINDFHDEGFTIIRVEDITEAFSKESDSFYEEVCINEGLKKRIFGNPLSDVADFNSVLEQLVQYEKFITVQCEFEDDELYYSIGKLVKIKENVIFFKNFDKMGVWEKSSREIPFDKITMISIEDNYSKTFYKYVSVGTDS